MWSRRPASVAFSRLPFRRCETLLYLNFRISSRPARAAPRFAFLHLFSPAHADITVSSPRFVLSSVIVLFCNCESCKFSNFVRLLPKICRIAILTVLVTALTAALPMFRAEDFTVGDTDVSCRRSRQRWPRYALYSAKLIHPIGTGWIAIYRANCRANYRAHLSACLPKN